MASKKKVDPSRRNFLFGAVRRMKGEAKPEEPIAVSSETIPLLTKANIAYNEARYDDAVELYRDYLKLEKADVDTRIRLGICLYRAGKHGAARLEFKRVLKSREKDEQSILYLGLTFCRTENAEKAVETWRMYFNPKNINVMRELNLQTGFLETGDFESWDAVAEAVEKAMEA